MTTKSIIESTTDVNGMFIIIIVVWYVSVDLRFQFFFFKREDKLLKHNCV